MGGEVNPFLAYSVFAPLCCWFGVATRGQGTTAVNAVSTPCSWRASHNTCDATALPIGWPGGMDTASMSRCYWRMAQLGAIIMEP